jgi:hypothetical protein
VVSEVPDTTFSLAPTVRTKVLCGFTALCGFLVLAGAHTLAQTGASRIALATVFDPRNRPIVDVEADDFVVSEGRDAREILSVHLADYPVVVMIDTSAAAGDNLPVMQNAAAQFIARIGQRPVALGTFGDPPTMLTTFEDERTVLTEKLDALTAAESGDSLLMQGAALAAQTIRPTGSIFSAIVMLSASATDASRDADALVPPIVETGAILHVVINRAPSGPPAAAAAPSAPVRVLVEQTRGQYTPIYTAASFNAALDQIANRMATEIMIEYLVPPQSKANDVKIGVRIPGARVRGFGVAPR